MQESTEDGIITFLFELAAGFFILAIDIAIWLALFGIGIVFFLVIFLFDLEEAGRVFDEIMDLGDD